MSHRITSARIPPGQPAAGPGPAQAPQAPQAPAQPAAPAAGPLGPRTTRAQERANHQLRAAIRANRHPGVPAAAAETAVQAAMAQGAEPSRPARSGLRTLLQAEGHGNTALHYLALYGTPAMSAEVVRRPLEQGANLDANAPSRGLASGGGSGATPLHLAVESFNGAVLRDLLAIPGADVRRRYVNPSRAALVGGHTNTNMSVIETAEFLARNRRLTPAQRQGLVTGLVALVEHGERDGYTVNCGPLAGAVMQMRGGGAPAQGDAARAQADVGEAPPSYGESAGDPLVTDQPLPPFGHPPGAQAGPSSAPVRALPAAATGRGPTPLHEAIESFDGERLRQLLAAPGADVHRRNVNPPRANVLGGPARADMTVVETAEFLARQAILSPAQRRGLVVALRALVDHGRQNGYTVNCGPLENEVGRVTPPPAYGDPAGDATTSLPATDPTTRDDPQAGPSSRP
jgi:ankyrin repeat protein